MNEYYYTQSSHQKYDTIPEICTLHMCIALEENLMNYILMEDEIFSASKPIDINRWDIALTLSHSKLG